MLASNSTQYFHVLYNGYKWDLDNDMDKWLPWLDPKLMSSVLNIRSSMRCSFKTTQCYCCTKFPTTHISVLLRTTEYFNPRIPVSVDTMLKSYNRAFQCLNSTDFKMLALILMKNSYRCLWMFNRVVGKMNQLILFEDIQVEWPKLSKIISCLVIQCNKPSLFGSFLFSPKSKQQLLCALSDPSVSFFFSPKN